MHKDTLEHLASACGILTHYVDAWGKPATIPPENIAAIAGALGYPVEEEEKLARRLAQEVHRHWQHPLDTVYVIREGQPVRLRVRLPVTRLNARLFWEIQPEDKPPSAMQKFPLVADERVSVDTVTIKGHPHEAFDLVLEADLPPGYHPIRLVGARGKVLAESCLIITPGTCYQPAPLLADRKLWGLSVQLYTLRSETNWGVGDFSDLKQLVQHAAKVGADFIGLNPLHALAPAQPALCSPYSPSSRLWLNSLYIDVTQVPGFRDCESVQEQFNSEAFQTKLATARATEWVDYAAVAALKYPMLRRLFDEFVETHVKRRSQEAKAFQAFVRQGGTSLQTIATFDALQVHLHKERHIEGGWPVWPKKYQDAHRAPIDTFREQHPEDIRFFCFLQWQAARQLEAAHQAAVDAGMALGLYRDLAVGSDRGGADVWADKTLYCTEASIGAPPDDLGPLGQNWGLPPIHPHVLRQRAFKPFIDLLRANMAQCGALRIDHVMGLMRQWWIKGDEPPSQGAYVAYPLADLLGILALESHRHQCLIVGEDLGTVPEDIRQQLANHGVYSYRVFLYEQAEDKGFYSPAHYPAQSLATLTTHDSPTITGYWHCKDLELGARLGLYPDPVALKQRYDERLEAKQQMLNSLHGHHSLPDTVGRDALWTGMTRTLNFAMQIHLARGASRLLSLQLEDWLEMDQPVNVPGTSEEYPNWRRKLTQNLDTIFQRPELIDLAQRITRARQDASQTE